MRLWLTTLLQNGLGRGLIVTLSMRNQDYHAHLSEYPSRYCLSSATATSWARGEPQAHARSIVRNAVGERPPRNWFLRLVAPMRLNAMLMILAETARTTGYDLMRLLLETAMLTVYLLICICARF